MFIKHGMTHFLYKNMYSSKYWQGIILSTWGSQHTAAPAAPLPSVPEGVPIMLVPHLLNSLSRGKIHYLGNRRPLVFQKNIPFPAGFLWKFSSRQTQKNTAFPGKMAENTRGPKGERAGVHLYAHNKYCYMINNTHLCGCRSGSSYRSSGGTPSRSTGTRTACSWCGSACACASWTPGWTPDGGRLPKIYFW